MEESQLLNGTLINDIISSQNLRIDSKNTLDNVITKYKRVKRDKKGKRRKLHNPLNNTRSNVMPEDMDIVIMDNDI